MFCPSCGNALADNAMFCGKCGSRIAAQGSVPPTQGAASPMQGSASPAHRSVTPGGFSTPNVQLPRSSFASAGATGLAGNSGAMTIARGIAGILAIIMIFMPWIGVSFSGVSISANLLESAAEVHGGWFIPLYIIGGILMIGGAAAQLVTQISACKWASLAGSLVIAVLSIMFVVALYSGGNGYACAFTPWIVIILSFGSAVTCFIAR